MSDQIATVNWDEVRSSGYAAAVINAGGSVQSAYFDAPMISHIAGDLYVGGCEDGLKLDDDFDTVVSLYMWGRYELGPDTERIEFEMYDSKAGADQTKLDEAAAIVVDRLIKFKKVLVHCQAGLNRSNLVAARALMMMGMSAREAIDLLREKRSPLVLCNQTFVQQLLALDTETDV